MAEIPSQNFKNILSKNSKYACRMLLREFHNRI